MKIIFAGTGVILGIILLISGCKSDDTAKKKVSRETMERIYQEIKTPFKHGVVFQHADTTKMIDSPTIFREKDVWYMTYIVFDGQGYETWLASSKDLLHWESKGKLLSFTENTWDPLPKSMIKRMLTNPG
jgi:predicted GH43/DUF377 family glycosyl hydrolase